MLIGRIWFSIQLLSTGSYPSSIKRVSVEWIDDALSFRLESGGLNALSPEFVIFTQQLSILDR